MNNAEQQFYEGHDRIPVTRRHLIKLGGLSSLFGALTPGLAKAASFFYLDEAPPAVSHVMQQLSEDTWVALDGAPAAVQGRHDGDGDDDDEVVV